MRRGVLGIPTDSSDLTLEQVEDRHSVRMGGHGNDLTSAMAVLESITLGGDTVYYQGEGFRDREEERDYYNVDDDGRIRQEAKHVEIVQDYGEFVARPADETDPHRGFVLLSSSEGEFLFPMIGRQNSITIERAEIRLGEWVRDHDALTTTTAGGRTSSFDASKMTAWGDDVFEDDDIADLLSKAVESNALSQVAGEYVYEGVRWHVTLAASGYAEVYSPTDLTAREFIRWISEEVVPYATGRESES